MDTIQFDTTQYIMLPTDANLSHDCLCWRAEIAEDGFEDPFRDVGKVVSIAGCLDAFTLLGDASPESVLAFTRQYGVLGIMPSGETEAYCGQIADEPSAWRFRYDEPVSVYQTLARQARSILLVMAALRSGKQIDPDVFLACFPAGYQARPNKEAISKAPRRRLYMEIVTAAQRWSEVASYKFTLGFGNIFKGGAFGGSDTLPQTLLPQYRLEFGDWNQGAVWDLQRMPTLIEGRYSDKAFGDAVRETALRVAAAELGVGPPDHVYCLPSHYQRPSPLFNVLAFQLTQALTLKEGTYFCSGCKKFTAPKEGRNKPREDKETWNCSAACEVKSKAASDKKRGSQKKQSKPADQ